MINVSELELIVINHSEEGDELSVGASHSIKVFEERLKAYNSLVRIMNEHFKKLEKNVNKVDCVQLYLDEVTPQLPTFIVIARDYDSIYVTASIVDGEGNFYGDLTLTHTNCFDEGMKDKVYKSVREYLEDKYKIESPKIIIR